MGAIVFYATGTGTPINILLSSRTRNSVIVGKLYVHLVFY